MTSTKDNALLWFGAAISLAEILSGTLFAPLGIGPGLLAIILGHVIGGLLMFGCGRIGAQVGQPAMATTASAFGQLGAKWFAGLNSLQLLGWTAVMILAGAQAAQVFVPVSLGFWAVIIGVIIAGWLLIGLVDLGKWNTVAAGALLIAVLFLSVKYFASSHAVVATNGHLAFGAALELAIAMPLSWLPLISDYTSQAAKPLQANTVSVWVYGLTSTWMFAIGLVGTALTDKTDIAGLMQGFGLGFVALIVIILSTITTTFLDVYSAGVSAALFIRLPAKWLALIVTGLGTAIAVFVPQATYADFLYWISAVFVPLAVIQITCAWLNIQTKARWDWPNWLLWGLGVAIYRLMLNHVTVLGSTIPTVIMVAGLSLIFNWRRRS